MPPTQGMPLDKLQELLSGVDPEQLRKVLPLVGGLITMMFTDIVNSTRITHEVGDSAYFYALERHNSLLRACFASHGHELKTIGNSFLVGFTDPSAAVECAIRMQRALADEPIVVGAHILAVRIGLHTGKPDVYRDDAANRTDLRGGDVNKSARVEGLARGGQVLISDETRTMAKPERLHDWGIWELKGLGAHRIFEVLYPGRQAAMPAGRMSLEPLRFATSFVGREREVPALMDAVRQHRLVTLTGMGGIGKTRLADAVARRLSDAIPDGTYFVELATTADSEGAVISALIAALQIDPAGFASEGAALLATLQHREALLVLDNFEAVMAAAGLVGRLFTRCPRLCLLTTAQFPLNIDGEHVHPAPQMATPAAGDAAVLAGLDAFMLFGERARARVPGWDARSAAETAAVRDILTLLEGIPLSIELAAAWVGSRTLEEIREGLSERLRLLRRRAPGQVSRHDSIEASLDYSFSLLAGEARDLLPRLAVFAGGFFAADAAAVCGVAEAAALLIGLHERNWLIRQEILGRSRYSLLATVQQYAADKLPAEAAEPLRQAHASHFWAALAAANQELTRSGYAAALARIDADIANFEAAIANSRARDDHRAVFGLIANLGDFLRIKARYGDVLAQALAARASARQLDAETLAGAENNLGNAYRNLPTGDRGANLLRAIACYEAALRVWTEQLFPQQWAMTQNNLGNAYADLPSGDRGANVIRAIDCYEAALRVRTEQLFPQQWATTQNNLGAAYAALPTGDRGANLLRAIACYEAALRVRTEQLFPQQWATTRNNLGVAYADLPTGDRGDNLRHAIACYEAALRVRTEQLVPQQWAMTQNNLGTAYADLPTGDRGDNLRRAIACYEAALRVWTEQQFPQDWAMTQNNLGIAYRNLPNGDRGDNLGRAIACYEAALRVWTEQLFPQDWATTQNNLGVAYRNLPTGDRGDNLRREIACYEAALRVRTEQRFPQGWAGTQSNLANAYADLPSGDRGDNLRQAIACYEAAARGYDAVGMTDAADRARDAARRLGKQ